MRSRKSLYRNRSKTEIVAYAIVFLIVGLLMLAATAMFVGWLVMLGLMLCGVSFPYWNCVGVTAIALVIIILVRGK